MGVHSELEVKRGVRDGKVAWRKSGSCCCCGLGEAILHEGKVRHVRGTGHDGGWLSWMLLLWLLGMGLLQVRMGADNCAGRRGRTRRGVALRWRLE